MMIRSRALGLALCFAVASVASAQEDKEIASADEAAKVAEAIAKVGCKATEIEKESATLFEIDDAQCEIGQYDIKLNGEYRITVMTIDE